MSIPTVGAAAANIVKYAIGYDFEYTNGMPIRYVGFPFPVAGQPKSVHHRYVFEGNDVVSGKPMMQAIIDALTKPLTEKEKISGPAAGSEVENRDFCRRTPRTTCSSFSRTTTGPTTIPSFFRRKKEWRDAQGNQPKAGQSRKDLNWPGGIATAHGGKSRCLRRYGRRQTGTLPADPGACNVGAVRQLHQFHGQHDSGQWPHTESDRDELRRQRHGPAQ